jgi:hypothetical protein
MDYLDILDIKAIDICPNLTEWRRLNISTWQRILKESCESGDKRREVYARWMLDEVLKPDFPTPLWGSQNSEVKV